MARSGLVMLAGLAVGVLASSGLAQNRVEMSDPGTAWRNPGFNGGAFLATHVQGYIGEFGGPGSTATSFLTFCLEKDEFLNLGSTYFATIDVEAHDGGVGGPTPDPISPETAAMYQQFRSGASFGASGVLDTAAETQALQLAIWFSEQEISLAELQADPLADALYTWAQSNNSGGIGNVRVLNLWDNANGTGHRQDVLTIVPLPPAAWAGLGSLAGVALIGVVRRRKQLS